MNANQVKEEFERLKSLIYDDVGNDDIVLKRCNQLIAFSNSISDKRLRKELLYDAYMEKYSYLMEEVAYADEAINAASEACDVAPSKDQKHISCRAIGHIYLQKQEYDMARKFYILGLLVEDSQQQSLCLDYMLKCEKLFLDSFKKNNRSFCDSYSYNRRQIIYMVKDYQALAGCVDPNDVVQWAFTLDNYPEDIRFSTDRPLADTIYMLHPAKNDYYIPFNTIEKEVLLNKTNEFCYLAQCLGATQIRIKTIKGKSFSQLMSDADSLNISGSCALYSLNETIKGSNVSKSSQSNKQKFELVQTFKPERAPYCPENLLFLKNEDSWLNMVRQRLDGNMLNYIIKISSSESCNINDELNLSIKAAIDSMPATFQLTADYNMNFSTSSQSHKENVIEISVDFADKASTSQNKGFFSKLFRK